MCHSSIEISKQLLDTLLANAAENPRLRLNYDLRTSSEDTSQRMLNALHPGTHVPIHRHRNTTETVVILKGHATEILYDENLVESVRYELNPLDGCYGVQIPKGVWHTIIPHVPSVIMETKDGAFEPLAAEDDARMVLYR